MNEPHPEGLRGMLKRPGPLTTVELRPPRSGLDPVRSMDVWIDMYHSIQRLARQNIPVLLTDDAVGDAEEESLAHLSGNLAGDVGFDTVVPFLTAKHTLEYCRMFASRAASLGVAGLAVLGGDKSVGPPRCVPHAKDLRKILREDHPALLLGGWTNPHRDIPEQVGYLQDSGFAADFVLTQVVSHHSIPAVEAFQDELARRNVDLPIVYGVFLYRSANPRTLDVLGQFFPVPAEEITAEFESGATAEAICARSIRSLREAGGEKIYVSNLGSRNVAGRLEAVLDRV